MFDKELDISLVTMLEADSEKRAEILEFISSLPKPLLEDIRTDVRRYYGETVNYEHPVYTGYMDMDGVYTDEDGMYYEWNITIGEQEKSIEIVKKISEDQDGPQVNFGSSLILVKEFPSYEPEEAEPFWIGTFTRMIDISQTSDLDGKLKSGFIPQIKIEGGKATGTALLREIEHEYYLSETTEGQFVTRIKYPSSEEDVFPVDLTALPKTITLEILQERYGESPKINMKQ